MTHPIITIINILVMATARAEESDLDSLRQSVPGEPGTDYPILAAIPDTDFSCQVTSEVIRMMREYREFPSGQGVWRLLC